MLDKLSVAHTPTIHLVTIFYEIAIAHCDKTIQLYSGPIKTLAEQMKIALTVNSVNPKVDFLNQLYKKMVILCVISIACSFESTHY